VPGNIHPVSSRIPGTVIPVTVNDNDEVKEGELLVELDQKDYKAE
jgi:membrane fusion protein (multidrug efflux system)